MNRLTETELRDLIRQELREREAQGTIPLPAIRSNAAALVRAINAADIPHRKGWKPSDYVEPESVLPHLEDEVAELRAALIARAGDPGEELADVFMLVLQIADRLAMPFDHLDAEAVRKLRLRFPGADRLEVKA